MTLTFADSAEQLHQNGYTPIPVITGEKRPAISKWTEVNYAETPTLLQEFRTKYSRASTGILLGSTCVVDIDVLDEKTANLCLELVTSKLGKAPIRQGRAPKTALFFKVEGPTFKKLTTQPYLIDGERAQVEILCEGQQVVVFGIHPDTQQPYRWVTPNLLEVTASDLPTITKTQAEQLIGELTAALSPSSFQSQGGYQPVYGQNEFKNSSPKSREGRNGYLYSKGCTLRAAGIGDEVICSVLPQLNRSATTADHPNFAEGPLPIDELNKTISSILSKPIGGSETEEQDLIERLNKKHAVVMVGGKCVIANEEFDPTFGHQTITFSSQNDFRARYANHFIGRGKTKISEGRAWLNHPNRRQYDGVVFAPGEDVPGHYNLDRGFAVTPTPGDCSLFREHIHQNICNGDEKLSNYLWAWMADCVQNRGKRPGVSVVMRGRQGTGKSIFCREFGGLFGRHFIHISQSGHLTGHFNSHLKDKIVVYADEAFWAGDKRAEGVLKALITEDTIQIEMKGKDVITFRNYIRLLISSNHEWVVPAGNEERRFFILEVGDQRMQDRSYFGRIMAELNNGGREALLHELLSFDLTGIDVGSPPRTNALLKQKAFSASPLQKWWYERISDGHILSDQSKWETEIRCSALHEDYLLFTRTHGVKYPLAPSAFGKALRDICPSLTRARPSDDKKRYYIYRLDTLDICRQDFDRITMSQHDWDRDDR